MNRKIKTKILFLIILCFGFFGVAKGSQAATYYVSTSGKDGNVGSISQPWKTIQKASSVLVAGDTAVINAGTYDERVVTTRNGISGSPITFLASGTVIMKGFEIRHDYINIDGFEITNTAQQYSIEIYGSYCQILNNKIHDTSQIADMEIAVLSNSSQNCLIKGNHIWSSIAYGGDHPAIYLDGQTYTVEQNEIGPIVDADAFRLFGSGHIIKNNYIHDLTLSADSGAHMDIMQAYGDNGDVSHDMIFENNLIKNTESQMFMTSQDGIADIRDWDVRNNIWINVGYQGNIGIPNFRFYNNVLYNVDPANGFALALYNASWGAANNAKIKNNIFIGPGGLDYEAWENGGAYSMDSGLTGVETDYNYVTGNPANGYPSRNTFSETHGINGGDPKFANLSNWDFHLQAGSPAINHGVTISNFNFDKDNILRPQGSAWDIGAYEYVTSGDTTAPASPGGLSVN
jgi:hypothetical protein